MRRLLILCLVAASSLNAAETTHLVAAQPSRLVLEGSSNVAPWRCSGTTLDGRMNVAAPLDRINEVIDLIEDVNIAQWMVNPAGARFPQPDFELRIPVNTLRCGNRQMERDMYRALRSDTYPTIEFRFAELIGGVNHDIDGASYHAKIAGVLTLAGAKKNVAVDVIAQRVARDRFKLHARLPLRMTDFRITPPTAMFGLVKAKDDLVVQFDLMLEDHS